MFDRFRDSLVYPRRIVNFRKDKFIRVFGYMMMFAILMLTSTIVLLARFDRIPEPVRDLYQESLTGNEIGCVLDEGDLTCDSTPVDTVFYDDTVGLIGVNMIVSDSEPNIENITPLSLNVYFTDGMVYVFYGGYEFEYTYDELPEEFSNIDFSLAQSSPGEFTDIMMDGLGEYLKSIGNIIAPILLISGFIGNIFMVAFIVFMNAFILKMRFRVIPFKETFNMGVYLGTTLYILLIINGFFGLGIFTFILFLILTFRQTNAISYEIMSRMKK